jgi:hypothetical protein
MKPLIIRLAESQRLRTGPDARYDESLDELTVMSEFGWIPALDSGESPETKKADLEKGEDQKDKWTR